MLLILYYFKYNIIVHKGYRGDMINITFLGGREGGERGQTKGDDKCLGEAWMNLTCARNEVGLHRGAGESLKIN